ncbi:HNH endonuclease signature motif containing protein [Euzebya rosea]|uniref:HNH endonuclease signature motif containing protein n=1 Tax=Euzebya rosea TaxID=2052804 RepID=UPI000D3E6DAE|nr:HNH endonuclease signature motif containing protein [Euzebya rosea]
MGSGVVEAGEVTELVTHLHALASRFDPDAIPDRDVAGLIADLGRAGRIVDGMLTRAARRTTEADAHHTAGAKDAATLIATATGTTPAAARKMLRTSAQLVDQPEVDRAVTDGTLSTDQAVVVSDTVADAPEKAGELIVDAASQSLPELRKKARDIRTAADPDREATRRRHLARRAFRSWTETDGEWKAFLQAPGDLGARIEAALRGEHDAVFRAAHAAGRREDDACYRFDALLNLLDHPTRDLTGTVAPPTGTAGDGPRTGSATTPAQSTVLGTTNDDVPDSHTPGSTDPANGDRADSTDPTDGDRAGSPDASVDVVGGVEPGRDAPGSTDRSRTTTDSPPGLQPDGPDPGAHVQDPDTIHDGSGRTDRTDNDPPSDDPDRHEGSAMPGPDAGPLGHPPPQRHRPSGRQTKVIIRVDGSALVRGELVDGEVCEIAGIGPVALSAVREQMLDAHIAYVITNATDVTVAHLGRQVTARQRTALEARGYRCEVPGCTADHLLEIDHVTGWAITRTTELSDLAWLCAAHHRDKTRRNHQLHGPPGQRIWTTEGGVEISRDPPAHAA